jgi:acyl-CoA synthetase (AMP-forming)/AMP-acid ligase II
VAGRLKDLVIVRGKKHYPQDLELSAETSHPSLRPGGCAAFALEAADGDSMVIVAEVEPRWWCRDGRSGSTHGSRAAPQGAIAAVRQALSEEHQLRVDAIVLIVAGGLPRTTSGKRQRLACRAAWQAGTLPVIAAWSQTGEPAPRDRPLQEVG